MDQRVAEALVDLVIFLDQSGDDIVDPDAAVAALEQLEATLSLAEDTTKRSLIDEIQIMAENRPAIAHLLADLPASLGIQD